MANIKKVIDPKFERKLKLYHDLSVQKYKLDREVEILKYEIMDDIDGIFQEKGVSCGDYTAVITEVYDDVIDTQKLAKEFKEAYYDVSVVAIHKGLRVSKTEDDIEYDE